MGKQYAILRVQKCKGAAIGAMQYHNDREPGKHTNPDIDQTRTRLNREMRSHVDYEREVQARIDDGYSGERKVRKDAVNLVGQALKTNPDHDNLLALNPAPPSVAQPKRTAPKKSEKV